MFKQIYGVFQVRTNQHHPCSPSLPHSSQYSHLPFLALKGQTQWYFVFKRWSCQNGVTGGRGQREDRGCLSFISCCCEKGNLREKGLTWLTVPGNSQSLWGGQEAGMGSMSHMTHSQEQWTRHESPAQLVFSILTPPRRPHPETGVSHSGWAFQWPR